MSPGQELIATRYDIVTIGLSLLLASFASYVAFDLCQRIRVADRSLARFWWAGGSVTMGTGIWAMHFVAIQAVDHPFEACFDSALTAGAWAAAVSASAIVLHVADHARLTHRRLAAGALGMGLGICAMQYVGMVAMRISPAIRWSPGWFLASLCIAIMSSASALWLAFALRRVRGDAARGARVAAALVLGCGMWAMQCCGIIAADFATHSVCLEAGDLGGGRLDLFVAIGAFALLTVTILTSALDARVQGRVSALAISLQRANDELRRIAFRDPLTGLPNRLLFEDRLQSTAARCVRNGDSFFILVINLDKFDHVNVSFGYALGDDVLCQVARRIEMRLRSGDTVARLGGDEFIVLVEGHARVDSAALIAQQIGEAVSDVVASADGGISLSCSTGIAVFPVDGPSERLMAYAADAMHAVKRTGGGRYGFSTPNMTTSAREQVELCNDLRHAMERGELELHFQPKIRVKHGSVAGLEALIRWRSPSRGMVGPCTFIPVAERFGLIDAIGCWVIDRACLHIAQWRARGLHLCVAVNVSAHQILKEGLVEHVARALAAHAVPASLLILEVTESAAMEDMERTQSIFARLTEIGVALSIDDFGTGHSSLSYLRDLKVRQLKIDRSFVRDLESSNEARIVVKAVIDLAHALLVEVVAEGVETVAQRDLLTLMQCDELQGYLYSKPLPADEAGHWVAMHECEQPKG